jgi:hypothetical protein
MGKNRAGIEDGLTKHQRYTATAKGQERNRRYEEAHPERGQRLRTGMVARDVYQKVTEEAP